MARPCQLVLFCRLLIVALALLKNPIEIGSEFSGLPLGLASVLVVVVEAPRPPPPFSSFLH